MFYFVKIDTKLKQFLRGVFNKTKKILFILKFLVKRQLPLY